MTTPLITVYITNHNYGRFIVQAVESVLNQTLQDLEIIIIDDESTDNSREIIEQYNGHPKIRIIHQQHKGLNITNNMALRVAVGRYIMRLDADDYLDPHALELMSGLLEKDESLGLVFPDYYLVDVHGDVIGIERRHDFDKDVTLLDQPAHGACTMIRRSYLLDVGGYDESYSCQDGYELWVKFTARHRVKNLNLPLFYYRQHGSNLTRSEHRILSTRTDIKHKFAEMRDCQHSVLAILPVRGEALQPGSFALQPLGEERLVIDWAIASALASRRIDLLVVTTSDPAIQAYLQQRYGDTPRVRCMPRPPELGRMNSRLEDTYAFILKQLAAEFSPDIVVKMDVDYPFLESRYLDDAVNTLLLFEAQVVVSVRPETSVLYQHHGDGLVPVVNQDKFLRLEREALFKVVGGLAAFLPSVLAQGLSARELRRGHVVIDQRSAHGLRSRYEYQVANMLAGMTPHELEA